MSILPGWFPGGAGRGPPATLTYIGSTEDNANLTTYSFAAHAIGVDDPTRRVIAAFSWRSGGTARTIVSATIGGAGATVHCQAMGLVGEFIGTGIFSLLGVAGTTATITITLTGAAVTGRLGVWNATNESVATPNATLTDNTMTSFGLGGTLAIPDLGWAVGVFGAYSTYTSATWVGLTENYDAASTESASSGSSGASASGLAAEAARAISATSAGTPAGGSFCAMSWG